MALQDATIVHINTETTWRGGEQQVVSLMKGLRARGFTNLGVVRPGSPLENKLRDQSFSTVALSPMGEWDVLAAIRLRRLLREQRFAVFHAHAAHAAGIAAMAVQNSSVPLVISRRVDFPLARNPFSRWKYRQADRILAISERVRNVLIESGLKEEVISLVPSGVDFDRYKGVAPATRKEMGVPEKSIILGNVAALEPHKDHYTFLHAFAAVRESHPDVHAVIIGHGSLRAELVRVASRLGVADQVRFLGFREDVLRFLAGFQFFCLSSSEEGLGTTILDAMALQIPVIATAAGGIPEMVKDGETGFLAPPRQPAILAERIKFALDNPKKLPKIIEAARKTAWEFRIENTVDKTIRVYEDILDNKKHI